MVGKTQAQTQTQIKSFYFMGNDPCRYIYMSVRRTDDTTKIIVQDDYEDWEITVINNTLTIRHIPYRENEEEWEEEIPLEGVKEITIKRCWICGGCSCEDEYNPNGIECGHEEVCIYP